MIEKVVSNKNMLKAIRQTVSNKGASGVDGMSVRELKDYYAKHKSLLLNSIILKYVSLSELVCNDLLDLF